MNVKESEIAGSQVTKLLGVFRWFEWEGRKFDLAIVCKLLGKPLPETSEYEKDKNFGCALAAGVIGRKKTFPEMHKLLDAHDRVFDEQLEQQRKERK